MLYNKMHQKPTKSDTDPNTGKEDKNGQDQNQKQASADMKKAPTETPRENKVKLLLDATCNPSDIRYPTELSLLNERRGKA